MSFILHMDVKRLLTLLVVLVSSAAVLLIASVTSQAAVENGKIAFTSKYKPDGGLEGNLEVWSMNAGGTGLELLLGSEDKNFRAPVWSPDGTKIAYVAKPSDGSDEYDTYVVDAGGVGMPLNLTNSASSKDQEPAWSPDGSMIAFQSDRNGKSDIYVVKADGSEQASNLTGPGQDHDPGDSVNDKEPTWSPDGEKIAFSSKAEGEFDIWVIDPHNQHNSSSAIACRRCSLTDHVVDWGESQGSVGN